MKILFCGDIVGRAGRDVVIQLLPDLRKRLELDFIIVNGENSANGFGITEKTISKLKSADGLVVGSAICKEISKSIKKRQNPVTKLNKVVYNLKNQII